MTSDLAPLALPDTSDRWQEWYTQHCAEQLARARSLVSGLKSGTTQAASASDTLRGWNDVNIAMRNAFGLSSLLAQVHPDEDMRSAAENGEQEAHRLLTEIGLDRDLYDVLAAVDPGGLDPDAERVLSLSLRDFRRAGVDQEEQVRARLRELAERETAVAQEFSKNVRDAVGRVRVHAEKLEGLPADYVAAHPAGDDGTVEITTDYPDYIPFMSFAQDRFARRELLQEFLNRAWPVNDRLLHELLDLRHEHARILGYDDWPSYDAEVKMIGDGAAIPQFIDRISAAAEASARRDYAVLLDRLRVDVPEADTVDSTDKSYYAEVIRRESFDVDAQEVREYFDFAKVRAGLLEVTGRLFDLEYVDVPDAPGWHEDVATYDVRADDVLLGRIRLDLHPREGKYKHAAQFDLIPGIADRQLPEGVLVCNFGRGLMEHDDVVTLFHEFGHLLHHVLAGRHAWARFSGVATEWDFVEAPSQMLEEWAWDVDVLRSFATNAAGEPIPAELVEKMRAAKEFGKGYAARTQMFYAALSYRLHQEVPDDVTAVVRRLQGEYDLFSYVPGTHFQASFGHLQGYTSGYYTYMWSLVIAKDLFSAFDADDVFDTEVAHRYRDLVLAAGGSRDAADLVEDFLGRPYSFDAFETWLNQG
ncbi:MAG TPA: M3 family metallopeptidase [Nocardioidaceae bacterium]|nr:M3 family metallopeptidase [Nocardioidaceae bacterium]